MKQIRFLYVRFLLCCFSVVFVLSACGGGSSSAPDNPPPGGTGSDTSGDQPEERSAYAYVKDGPYADVLWNCTASWVFQPCSFEAFPLIGQETMTPDIEDIMNRVLVSHDWMGENFRTVLEQLPNDALLLFRSTTGIVITDSFASNNFFLGKIYIDPVFFWLTPAQRENIPQDARGTQASDGLRFRMPWRYVIVVWGQRGRIGEQRVYARVLSAVQSIYPGDLSAIEAFLAAQPPATQMKSGVTWREAAGSTE